MSRYTRGVRPHGPGGGPPPLPARRFGRGNAFRPVLPAPPEWTEDALCAQTDPEAFFPEKGGSTREAKAVCGRCEVRTQCLADALARGERFGVWGGLSERQRRALAEPAPETSSSPFRSTRELDAEVARLGAAGGTLASIARDLHVTARSVSRSRARLRANTTAETTTAANMTEQRRAA